MFNPYTRNSLIVQIASFRYQLSHSTFTYLLHTDVVSRPALELLQSAGIDTAYDRLVPHIVNRAETKILLARHTGESDWKLFAGYVKRGENAEKTIPRELKEETKLAAVKWRYFASRYHEEKDVLMLNFIVTADETDERGLVLNEEIEEARWFSPDEARTAIKKNSTAEYFLLGALAELGRKK